MKLKRLRIEQLRQFRQPLEIRDFDSGINLFTGPNESGKSSIVRAIRAAFFERYRSSSVDDLCPWDDSSSSPTVELDFDIGDTTYSLTKSFLHRKRCELKIGTRRLEGADAEDQLAEIFGFQFASKGASKPEHWGIPGLLWIEQGTGQEVHEAVYSATDHLHSALKESLGEVASSGGDEVLERVRAERATLLTNTGKPTGQLSRVTADLDEARTQKAALEDQIATYRQQVDTLGSLRQEHTKDEAERPWEFFLAKLKVAEETHANIEQLNQKLTQNRSQLAQFENTLVVLRQQITDFSQQAEDLSLREKAFANANERVEKSAATEAQISTRRQAAEEAYQNARDALQLARHADQRATLTRVVSDAQPRLVALETAIKSAQSAQTQFADLRKLAVTSEVDKRDLATLREQSNALRELEIQQAAIATRLEFDLEPDKFLTLDGETLSNQGERMLVVAGELGIPGVGLLRIIPGGTDLAELAREQDELREAYQALLQRIGVVSLEEAEQRYATYQQQLLDIRQAEQVFSMHAPKGLEALLADQAEIKARIVEAQAALAQVPSFPEAPALPMQQAETQLEDAREALNRIGQEANLAKQELVAAEANRNNALRERDALLQALQDPVRKQRQQDAERRMVEMNAERNTLAQLIDTQAQQIAEARPDILAQDINRLRRSAEQVQKQFRTRADEIIRLQTQLESVGAQGLEEQNAEIALQVEQLARRNAELTRRAQALDLLVNLLEGKRRDLTRRLQAPLQKHLNHYLHLLFPQASLEIDEDLTPGPLIRIGTKGKESSEFDALSFGAREQMGVISRLAYADLLQEAGRPTLIILDDALVHSDEQRLAHMKRILFDAAQRHQILLFTCHPGAWRDLGVAPRPIDSFRGA